VVRPTEATQLIVALDYEAYEPMATRLLQRLGDELIHKHGLLALSVEHSVGRVPVGACSFRLCIAAPHRKEALAAMEEHP
jgi:molybdopterin synthase catalytic subunit